MERGWGGGVGRPALFLRPSGEAGRAALVTTRSRDTATPDTAVPVTTACTHRTPAQLCIGPTMHAHSAMTETLQKPAKHLKRQNWWGVGLFSGADTRQALSMIREHFVA